MEAIHGVRRKVFVLSVYFRFFVKKCKMTVLLEWLTALLEWLTALLEYLDFTLQALNMQLGALNVTT